MALISKPINLSTEANLLYEIYRTLKKINIASGSSGSQNLAQTLLIDNKTNDIPIVSNNGNGYAYVNDEQTVIGNDFGGTKKITMNEDSFAIETNVRATIDGKGLQLGTTTDGFGLPRLTTTQMNAIAFPTEGMIVRNTTESKIYQFNGTVWEALTSSIPFEIQVTQLGTSAPVIVTGSLKGNFGATITPSYSSAGVYLFTASLPIFANVKNTFKQISNTPTSLLSGPSFFTLGYFTFVVISDTVAVLSVYNDIFAPGTPADNLITEPILLELPYN